MSLTPEPAHWVIRVLAAHNDYYPLKVLMEHALGEGMVLDIFRDVLLQTLPGRRSARARHQKEAARDLPRRRRARRVGREGNAPPAALSDLASKRAFYGLMELQLWLVPHAVAGLKQLAPDHPVLQKLDDFVEHVKARVWEQGRTLGFAPERAARGARRVRLAIGAGLALLLRSQVARSRSKLDKRYLEELGFR